MKLRVLSHTHWDREWFLPAYLVREWLPPFFRSLEERLRQGTTEHFVLDGQTILLEDAVKGARGDAPHRFRDVAADRRVSVGPYYQQPDWNLVSPEALIRNIRIGMEDAAALGGSMGCGWLMDNFGQISQCPQIHHSFGLHTVFMWRGLVLSPGDVRSEYRWESLDGSAVTAIYLLDSYRNGMQLLADTAMTPRRVAALEHRLAPFSPTGIGVVMNGYDQEMNPEGIAPLLAELRAGGMDIVQTSPDALAGELAAALEDPALPPLPVVRGEQYSGRYICVFPGVLSARTYLKVRNYHVETEMERYAEPLAVLARLAGGGDQSRELEGVWRRILRNHPHDSICGVSVDAVHRIMEERFGRIEGDLAEVESGALRVLVSDDNRRGGEIFNPLPWERTVVIPGVDGVHTVPPMGWGAVSMVDGANDVDVEPVVADPQGLSLTNRLITVHPRENGTITVIRHDPHGGDRQFDGLLGVEDCGDTGDTYTWAPVGEGGALRGTAESDFPPQGFREAHPPRVTVEQESPWRAALVIHRTLVVPAALAEDRQRRESRCVALPVVFRVYLDAGSPVVRVDIEVHNTARDHRLRLLIPHGTTAREVLAGTPADAVLRPAVPARYSDGDIPRELQRLMLGAREPEPIATLPFRDYLVCSGTPREGATGGWQGLAVVAPGLFEYEHLENEGTVALTLVRAVGWLARPDVSTRTGDAGPLMATPEAQCLRRFTCTVALVPMVHRRECATVARHAEELRAPCRYYRGVALRGDTPAGPMEGTAYLRTGLLALDSTTGAVQLSALEYRTLENRGNLEVRLYNPGDTPEEVFLRWAPGVVDRGAAVVTHLDGRLRGDTPLTPLHAVSRATPPHAEIPNATPPHAALHADRDGWHLVLPPHGIRQCRFPLVRSPVARREEERVDLLRRELEDAVAALSSGTIEAQAHHSTVRRTLLEAEISAIMAGGGGSGGTGGDAGGGGGGDERDEQALRRLGRELNKARIAKRTDDYLLALAHEDRGSTDAPDTDESDTARRDTARRDTARRDTDGRDTDGRDTARPDETREDKNRKKGDG